MEMAMTTMTTQLATDFVVPTIHLGSFKSYRLPSDRTPMTGNIDGHLHSNLYIQQQQQHDSNITPSRSASAPYPNMQNKPYIAKHPSVALSAAPIINPSSSNPVTTSPTSPRMLPSPAAQASPVPVQPLNNPPQTLGPPRELCLECMMRDEDMIDVDVTSPGVWDRESDVWYHELCKREEEEERERNLHPSTSSGISSSASCSHPRARGTKLTEGNLVVWLNLNPPEPTAKQQSLFAYLDTQNAILAAENKARIQALQEARQLDEKMRESFHESPGSPRSPYDFSTPEASFASATGSSIKARSPSTYEIDDPRNGGVSSRRDNTSPTEVATAAVDSKSRKSRRPSRDSLAQVDHTNRERDAAQFYGLNNGAGGEGGSPGPSTRSQAVYGSTASVPMHPSHTSVIRNVQSMYMPNTSSNWQPSSMSARPASMSPDVLPGFSSQTSLTSASPSPRKRFFGLRQWSGYFGSNVSLAQSGSMMDMHLGLDQDNKHAVHIPHVDIGSKPPSLQEVTPWPRTDMRQSIDNTTVGSDGPKKKGGLGKFWRMLSSGSAKSNERISHSHRHDLDEEPLAPPPPLSYLVNRGSMQSERSLSLVNSARHASMPSLSFSNTNHPSAIPILQPSKTASGRSQMVGVSSASDQSSTLPSPTDIRFPYRDGLSDGPGIVGAGDDEIGDIKRRIDVSPSRIRSLSQNGLATPNSFSFKSAISTSSPLAPAPAVVINESPRSMSTLPPSQHYLSRSFSVDKNLPPIPTEEDPDTSVVPTSVSTTIPVASSPIATLVSLSTSPGMTRSLTPSRATLPSAHYQPQPRQQQQPYGPDYPSSGFRYEEPIRRQSFNGPISRPNLPVGAGRASIPGLRQYGYDEFGNTVMSTPSRHSLAVGLQSLPSGTKRKTKLGLGSIFGRKQ